MPDVSPPWRDLLAPFLDRLRLPERLRHVDRRAMVMAAVALPLVAVVAAVVLTRPAPPRAALTLPRAEVAPSADRGDAAASGDSGGRPTEGTAVVAHAAGAVVRPGLYHLSAGARVADLLAAAGGAAPGADLDRLNLAARVADGERVHVPRVGEASAEPVGAGTGTGASVRVNLNTATLEQLDTLPGVGPATARAIVEYRTRHGRFRSVSQLLEVRGIGESRLAQLRPRVTV